MKTKKQSAKVEVSRRTFLSAAAVAGVGATLAFPRGAHAGGKPIGFIYVGPRMDYGYNTSMDLGRQFVEKTLKVKTLSQENVPESAEVDARHGEDDPRRLRDHLRDQLRLSRLRHRARREVSRT